MTSLAAFIHRTIHPLCSRAVLDMVERSRRDKVVNLVVCFQVAMEMHPARVLR